MKTAYLITKTDGATILLFERAHGIAGHFGWTVKQLTEAEAKAHIQETLKSVNVL